MEHHGIGKAEGGDWDEAPELWELQTGPHLTVGALVTALQGVDPSLEIELAIIDGEGHRTMHAVEIGATGESGARPRVVITAATL